MQVSRITSSILYDDHKEIIPPIEESMTKSKEDILHWMACMKRSHRYVHSLVLRCAAPQNYPNIRLYWLLDHFLDDNPFYIEYFANSIGSIFLRCDNPSTLRSVSRIILRSPAPFIHREGVLDRCAMFCLNANYPYAIRCNSLEIFTIAVSTFSDLHHELDWIFEYMSRENIPSIIARLKRCKKISNQYKKS
ncbi:hypothetical protein K4L44_16545 [Halosquirtibacter laminarini]|uniref:Uncharacterized protein n=1 Tax=Halosquirtibacter laminarini TaxID=3374600 RepID=A0AC61NMW9_9BACT|nr:hypothetical protein K4L44_16545 [Prolixibacteraceae bacterium]